MKKVVIFLGYSCNNNCIFCCNGNKRDIPSMNTIDVKARIRCARDAGCEYIEFVGGEPSIRKDIFSIIGYAKEIGYKTIMFATNGRMFAIESFAQKSIESGLNHIVFSIHGHNAELHDQLTRSPGSFEQLIKGIENVKKLRNVKIGTNTVIVRQNYAHLLEIGKLIFEKGIRNSEFIFVDPNQGYPNQHFYEMVPLYEEVSPYVNSLLKFGYLHKIPHWHIRYYPLCFISPEYHNMISEIHESKHFETVHLAPDFQNYNVASNRQSLGRIKTAKCKDCRFDSLCEGYWKEYAKRNCLKQIRLEITYKCDRNCSFCYNKNRGKQGKSYFSLDNFIHLIKTMSLERISEVRFTGGEPTAHPDFKEFVNLASDAKMRIIVNSNGALFEHFAELLSKIDTVIVSANNLADIPNIVAYSKRVKQLSVNTVLTPQNIRVLEEYYKLFEELPNVRWSLLRYIPDKIENELSEEDITALFSKLTNFSETIMIDNLFPFCAYYPETVSRYIRDNGVCNGRNTLIISPDGKIRVCNSISEEIGNISNVSPYSAWNSEFAKGIRDNKLLPKECRICKYLHECKGGCRYTAKLRYGRYDALDSLANPNRFIGQLP